MPAVLPTVIPKKGEQLLVKIAGSAMNDDLHRAALRQIGRAMEANGYMKLLSVVPEANGGLLTFEVLK